jgi:integrase
MAKGNGIIQRGDSYRVFVSYKDTDGHRRHATGTAHSITEAKKLKTQLQTRADTRTLTQPKGNLAEYLNRWCKDYANNLSPTTLTGYQSIIRYHITPAIGSLPLRNLSPEHLQRYYTDKIKTGLSTTTVRHHHTMLHRALKQAVQWGLLSRNPADMVTPPRNRRNEMHTLNESQVTTILNKAPDTYHCLFYLALQTGLRRGELLAIRWSDVNLDMAEMSISRSAFQMPGGKVEFKTVKTARSRRMIALSPQTCVALRHYLDNQMEIRARLGIPFKNDALVFSHLDGSPLKGNSVWAAWHKMLITMGITGIRFHDIRHTMATAMLQAGVHPKIVQERLGHASISTTLDIYSHVSPGLQQAAATKLDSIFSTEKVTILLPSAKVRV